MSKLDHAAIICAVLDDMSPAERYHIFTTQLVAYFADNPTLTLSTSEMGEALLPKYGAGGMGRGSEARFHIFKRLEAFAKAGTPFAVKSAERRINKFKKAGFPWIWSAAIGPLMPAEPQSKGKDVQTANPRRITLTLLNGERYVVRASLIHSTRTLGDGTTEIVVTGIEKHIVRHTPEVIWAMVDGEVQPLQPDDI